MTPRVLKAASRLFRGDKHRDCRDICDGGGELERSVRRLKVRRASGCQVTVAARAGRPERSGGAGPSPGPVAGGGRRGEAAGWAVPRGAGCVSSGRRCPGKAGRVTGGVWGKLGPLRELWGRWARPGVFSGHCLASERHGEA